MLSRPYRYTVGEQWLYRNPLAPGELTDDEIAVGDCMIRMADYARGGAGFYSLAEACQDRYLDIKMKEAETSGKEVRTKTQPWSVYSLRSISDRVPEACGK